MAKIYNLATSEDIKHNLPPQAFSLVGQHANTLYSYRPQLS